MEKESPFEFSYFLESQAEQFAFYRIPKALFTDDYFKKVSCEAKVLYGLMLDRMCLSRKNNWIDEKGRVYIVFSIEEAAEYLNCGRDKCIKTMAELDTKKGIGLIERIRRGLGRPDLIYVKNFVRDKKDQTGDSLTREPEPELEKDEVVEYEADDRVDSSDSSGAEELARELPAMEADEANYPEYEQGESCPISRSRKNRLPEVEKADFQKSDGNNLQKSEKSTSGNRKIRPLEVAKADPNDIDLNNTDKSNTESIYLSSDFSKYRDVCGSPVAKQNDGKMDQIKACEDRIRENIEYDFLISEVRPSDKECIDEIISVMVDAIGVPQDTVMVSGTDYPYQYVADRLMRVGYFEIQDIVEAISKSANEVKNIKAYILACVFNAPVTTKNYYRAAISAGGFG
ncbi:MAG: replication initiator protein A [Clostridiales bacterium]|nr:replication initiator protein A [Clostridiales bacterium]